MFLFQKRFDKSAYLQINNPALSEPLVKPPEPPDLQELWSKYDPENLIINKKEKLDLLLRMIAEQAHHENLKVLFKKVTPEEIERYINIPNQSDENTALHLLIKAFYWGKNSKFFYVNTDKENYLDSYKLLVFEGNADIQAKNKQGYTPLGYDKKKIFSTIKPPLPYDPPISKNTLNL